MKKKRTLSYTLRKRKPRPLYKKKWFWPLVLVAVVLGGLTYVFFISSFFKVKEIKFNVTEPIKADVASFVLPQQGKPMLFVNTTKTEKAILNALPYLKTISIKKNLPRTIVVEKAQERSAVFEFCFVTTSDICYQNNTCLMDEEGALFYKEIQQKLPLLLSNKKDIEKGELENIIALEKFFVGNLQKKLTKLVLENNFLNIYTEQGFMVFFDLQSNLSEKLSALKYLLENEIGEVEQNKLEYIDLRFTKIYYR